MNTANADQLKYYQLYPVRAMIIIIVIIIIIIIGIIMMYFRVRAYVINTGGVVMYEGKYAYRRIPG